MSYKNDSLLVIANKYGKQNVDAKSELFETYDKIRDITVSGPSVDGSGYGPSAKFLINIAKMFAPASFMPILGNDIMNVPGTSFWSSATGGTAITPGGQSAFGMSNLSNSTGFPSGGAAPIDATSTAIGAMGTSVMSGIGNSLSSLYSDFTIGADSSNGVMAGGASSLETVLPVAGAVTGVAAAAGQPRNSIMVPLAGVVAGIGGLITSVSPYFGPYGIAGGLAGNLMNGWAGAVLNEYQSVNARILNNADVIMQDKVKNIETIVKQLDTQSDIIKKMLKDSIESDTKVVDTIQ